MGMDVAEARDHAGNKFSVLSFVDIANGFHVARVVKETGGVLVHLLRLKHGFAEQVGYVNPPWIVVYTTGVRCRSFRLPIDVR